MQRLILTNDLLIHLTEDLIKYLLGVKCPQHARSFRFLRGQSVILFDLPLHTLHVFLIEAVVFRELLQFFLLSGQKLAEFIKGTVRVLEKIRGRFRGRIDHIGHRAHIISGLVD